MRVILTQDVDKLGQAMDVVTVADGFARNYLLPRSLAMAATKGAMASLENLRKQEDRRQDKLKGGAQIEADKLKDKSLDYSDANVGLGGRLYGSIGSADLAQMLKERFDVEIDKRNVLLQDPIRSEGFYTVPLKFHRDITVELQVKIGNPAPVVEKAAEPVEETAATKPKAEAVEVPVETVAESSEAATPGVE